MIYQMLGKLDARFTFETILQSVYQTISLKDLPRGEMTVKTAEMLMVYQSEKNRHESIKEAEKPE